MKAQEAPKVGRRSLLAAATGAIAALVGHAVTSPSRALAADGDPLIIGTANNGAALTKLSTPVGHAFEASSGACDGLRGASAGNGMSGVYGWSTHVAGHGVFGRNSANGNWGYLGGPNDAVEGHCAKPGGAAIKATTDIANATGVTADNSGAGTVVGLAGPIFGVLTQATGSKYGLINVGKAFFSRSGVVTVAKNKRTAKVSSIALTDYSYVFATMQYPRSGVYIQAALPNVDTDSITIYLNKAVTVATKVAWFVLDQDPI